MKLPRASIAMAAPKSKRAERETATPRKLLPPIYPGCALLTPAEGTGLKGPRVYVDEYNLAYNTTLNQMDIRTGVNRFYKMQLLASGKGGERYSVWRAWGRVGGEEPSISGYRSRGMNSDLINGHGSDLEAAKKEFHLKFKEVSFGWVHETSPPRTTDATHNTTQRTQSLSSSLLLFLLPPSSLPPSLRIMHTPHVHAYTRLTFTHATQPPNLVSFAWPFQLAHLNFIEAEPPCQQPGAYAVSLIPGQLGRDAAEAAKASAATRLSPHISPGGRGGGGGVSALQASVRHLVELIFSEKMMKAQMTEQDIDLDKVRGSPPTKRREARRQGTSEGWCRAVVEGGRAAGKQAAGRDLGESKDVGKGASEG